MTPENQGQLIGTYPSIKIPSMMGQQSTFYREVDPNGRWFNGQYEPTGKERSLLEYRIYSWKASIIQLQSTRISWLCTGPSAHRVPES